MPPGAYPRGGDDAVVTGSFCHAGGFDDVPATGPASTDRRVTWELLAVPEVHSSPLERRWPWNARASPRPRQESMTDRTPGSQDPASDPPFECRMHTHRRAPASSVRRPSATRVFVLVHGLGMSHRYFDVLQPVLGRHGDVLVADLPGFGGLPTPEHAMSVEDGAAALGRALDSHRITTCVLIGQSMGAQFVTELARRRPALVSHVVLIGPVTDTSHPSALRQLLALLTDALLEKPSTNKLVASSYAQCGIPWLRTEFGPMLAYPLDDRLADLVQPALIVRGSRDVISNQAWCRKLASRARRGRLVSIDGSPHAVDRNAAPQVTDAILEHVAELTATAEQEPR